MESFDPQRPVKRSVAVLVRNGEDVLLLRRPDDDEELPGIWGLPAGSYRPSETLEALIERIGREKLGVVLRPLRDLCEGVQDRPSYRLEMKLIEAAMEGIPSHREWRWAQPGALEPGKRRGSLCCDLALSL